MLGIDRRAASYAWTVALIVLLLIGVYLILKTLFVFTLALLLAYLLSPLVDLLDRVMPTRSRGPALALAYVIVVGLLVLFVIEVGSRVVEQANALGARIPDLLSRLEQQPTSGTLPQPVNSLKEMILSKAREQLRDHANDFLSALPKASLKVLGVASNLIFIVVVPILSFFFLKDGGAIRSNILAIVEDGQQRLLLEDIVADVHILLAQYMRALLFLCTATFCFYGLFFLLMGLPYGILLAAIAFPLEFIPLIGPLTAAAIIIAVTAVSGSHVLPIIVFLALYRIFQDYVLSPHLMSEGVELHPLMVIFGVFAGGELAGIPGTFLSVPVMALLRIIYRRIQKAQLRAAVISTPL